MPLHKEEWSKLFDNDLPFEEWKEDHTIGSLEKGCYDKLNRRKDTKLLIPFVLEAITEVYQKGQRNGILIGKRNFEGIPADYSYID